MILGVDDVDAVSALARAYAWIEYVEENTGVCVEELEAAKTAIGMAHPPCLTPRLSARAES